MTYLPTTMPSPPTTTPTPDRPNKPLGERICHFIIGSIIAIPFAAFIFFICWIIYIMIMPNPYFPQFEVESATVSNLNTQGGYLNVKWDITLLANNPNRKYKLEIDGGDAAVCFFVADKIIGLGSTSPSPSHFALKTMNDQTRVEFKAGVERLWIGEEAAQHVSNDMSYGSLKFGVKMDTAMRPEAVLYPADKIQFKVTCDDVAFALSGNNGTGVLASPSWCSVSQNYEPWVNIDILGFHIEI